MKMNLLNWHIWKLNPSSRRPPSKEIQVKPRKNEAQESIFLVLGDMHLLGGKSVPALFPLLAARGYKVQRLCAAETPEPITAPSTP
jgi:hypothetical protein